MDDYFLTIPAHVQGDVDLDVVQPTSESKINVVSLGSDDLIIWRNTLTGQSGTKQLELDHGFTRIALHPDGDHFILGGFSKKIFEFQMSDFQEKPPALLYECMGNILDLKYSSSGRYICAGTEQQKTIIIDRNTGKKTKCRPGHQNKIVDTFFCPNQRYVASIGQDCFALIYQLSEGQPLEVYRTKFCSELPTLSQNISGCFSKGIDKTRIFLPGLNELQQIQLLNSRWEVKKTGIVHSSPILACQTLNQKIIATSCAKDLCIWAIAGYQKIIVLEEFPLFKMISLGSTFYGVRNDGAIYQYNRPLPKPSNESEAHIDEESQINFDDDAKDDGDLNEQGQGSEQEQEQSVERQIQYVSRKKTKAQKIIQVFPQARLSRATQFFDEYRFLYTNIHGYIIENREIDESIISVQYQHRSGDTSKNQVKSILRNKEQQRQYKYFAMNSEVVVYASETQFGVKIDQFSSWQRKWQDIQGVALGGNWLAVANFSEIKFFDLSGNQIKSVCFDRVILEMDAYENLLVVVFHQSIPIDKSQNLAMQIFSITNYNALPITRCHVPVSPQYILRWFGFSKEGMIFSQDSLGIFRAFSLETNEWTCITAGGNVDPKKMWVIGIKDYQLIYWRTNDSDPQPTVRPRFNLKNSSFYISTLEIECGKPEIEAYPSLLWDRYCLDHEKARWKLWGRHKKTRSPQNINFELSETILNQKDINNRHIALDRKFYQIVQFYRKAQQILRAVSIVKSCVRSIQVTKDLMEYFDEEGLRTEAAIQLQNFIEEKNRQMDYEIMQQMKLSELKKKASIQIKPQKTNPMNPKNKKVNKDPLPPFSMSQTSQSSIVLEDVTHRSQQNSKSEQVFENPFLKKNSSDNNRKQHIEQQVEKFGIMKKKAQDKTRKNRH